MNLKDQLSHILENIFLKDDTLHENHQIDPDRPQALDNLYETMIQHVYHYTGYDPGKMTVHNAKILDQIKEIDRVLNLMIEVEKRYVQGEHFYKSLLKQARQDCLNIIQRATETL